MEDIREISLNKYSRCSIIPNMVLQMVGAAGGSMEVGRTRGTSHVSQPYIYFQQVFPFSLRAGIELGSNQGPIVVQSLLLGIHYTVVSQAYSFCFL